MWGMLHGLLGRIRKKNPKTRYLIPEGRLVYAIGDIHGRADLLKELHTTIINHGSKHPGKTRTIVYLGDYIDRGPYSSQTLDQLIHNRPDGFECIYLQGNHEEMLLEFLDNPSLLNLWLSLGGQSTLLSYGIQPPASGFDPERTRETLCDFLEVLPAEHLVFLKGLVSHFKVGDYLFVHAGILPGTPLQKQSRRNMLWVRDDFLGSNIDHGFKVIHGHTIFQTVSSHHNRIGIDTGAYASGVLTCAVLEEDRVEFLSTGEPAD